MLLHKDKKNIVFFNTEKDCETKKIPYDKVEQIKIQPRDLDYDIVIETNEEIVYLKIDEQEKEWNITSA